MLMLQYIQSRRVACVPKHHRPNEARAAERLWVLDLLLLSTRPKFMEKMESNKVRCKLVKQSNLIPKVTEKKKGKIT